MQTPLIGIHLDLKGVVFRHDYVPTLMADLAAQGINCVLVEYEDVFPFRGIDLAYDPETLWTDEMLAEFLAAARANHIEVIPLQQCLGHLEYVFRWKEYAHFVEPDCYPSTLALGNPEGRALVLTMLEQMIGAHPESAYVHLGLDEAHGLRHAAEKGGASIIELYVDWLQELVAVAERHGKTPIIWSDMLEDHFDLRIIEPLRGRVILNTWDYQSRGKRSNRGRIRS